MSDKNQIIKGIVNIIQLELSINKFRQFKVSDIINKLEPLENNIFHESNCFLYTYNENLIFCCYGHPFKIKKGLLYQQMLISFENNHGEDVLGAFLKIITKLFDWNDEDVEDNWVDFVYV